MKKLIVLLVGAALVLLSSVTASDCEDIIATDVSLGDDVLVQNGAAVTVSKEARDEYVEIMTARDEARYQLMIATGDLWIVDLPCDNCGAKAITVELDGGFLDGGLWQVHFTGSGRYGWVSYDDVVSNE